MIIVIMLRFITCHRYPHSKIQRSGYFLLLILTLCAACANPEPKPKGTLEIKIKDHREAIDDFTKLDVPLEQIRIKPSGGWLEVKPALPSIDLTAYRKGNSVTVYKGESEAAPFEGIDLKLGKLAGVLKKNNTPVQVKNSVNPVQIAFVIEPAKTTLLVLDLKVLDMSDHSGRGYELHINAFEHYRDGKLIERIPPA